MFRPLRWAEVADSGGVGLALAAAKHILTAGIQLSDSGKIPKRSLGPLPMDAKGLWALRMDSADARSALSGSAIGPSQWKLERACFLVVIQRDTVECDGF